MSLRYIHDAREVNRKSASYVKNSHYKSHTKFKLMEDVFSAFEHEKVTDRAKSCQCMVLAPITHTSSTRTLPLIVFVKYYYQILNFLLDIYF